MNDFFYLVALGGGRTCHTLNLISIISYDSEVIVAAFKKECSYIPRNVDRIVYLKKPTLNQHEQRKFFSILARVCKWEC